jgi:hypothetical protein
MNCGAFDHEEEILIFENMGLKIDSLTEEKDDYGEIT